MNGGQSTPCLASGCSGGLHLVTAAMHGTATAMPPEPDGGAAVLAGHLRCGREGGLMVLSTCNRYEVYVEGSMEAAHRVAEALREDLRARRGIDAHVCTVAGPGVARHLLRVAAGLESAILGDIQVLAQIREAIRRSEDHRLLTPGLRSLAATALALGREVRRDTSISAGGAGVGPAVADLVRRWSSDRGLEALRCLVLGAGQAGAAVARALRSLPGVDIVVANRTPERARELATDLGLGHVELAEAVESLGEFGVVVAAVMAPSPVLTEADLDRLAAAVPDPLVIDVGAPPSLPNGAVDVHRLESLGTATDPRRAGAVGEVEARCERALAEWIRRRGNRALDAVLADLYRDLGRVSVDIVEDLGGSPPGPALEHDVGLRLRGFLHPHIQRIRSLDPDRWSPSAAGGAHQGVCACSP